MKTHLSMAMSAAAMVGLTVVMLTADYSTAAVLPPYLALLVGIIAWLTQSWSKRWMAIWIGLSALAVWTTLPSHNALAAGSSAVIYTHALFYEVAGSFRNKLE